MNAALERLRERNRADVKLEDGDLLVTLELPPLRECILAGGIPLPLLQKIATAGEESLELATDQLQQFQQFQRVVVAKMVKAIEGEELDSLTPEDTAVFSDEQFYELVAYGMREKPLPGKA